VIRRKRDFTSAGRRHQALGEERSRGDEDMATQTRWLASVAGLVLVLGLAACGGDDDDTADTTTTTEATEATEAAPEPGAIISSAAEDAVRQCVDALSVIPPQPVDPEAIVALHQNCNAARRALGTDSATETSLGLAVAGDLGRVLLARADSFEEIATACLQGEQSCGSETASFADSYEQFQADVEALLQEVTS
jgi:hypothetical protein